MNLIASARAQTHGRTSTATICVDALITPIGVCARIQGSHHDRHHNTYMVSDSMVAEPVGDPVSDLAPRHVGELVQESRCGESRGESLRKRPWVERSRAAWEVACDKGEEITGPGAETEDEM